nr:probable LRR receptor-like serine/threonine-protein kinase At2g24230 [Ipomoea trifida]
MGLGVLACFLVVFAVCFRPLVCQQPNTDGFYVSDFLKKMGFSSPQIENLSAHFCAWEGVFCDAERVAVVKLVASGLGLSGVVPENTIGKLAKLESLDLSDNGITGLPSDVWSLGSLRSFNLSKNLVSGNLPSNIGNFGQLESLDLSFNNFSGSIPEAMSSLERLQVLNLSRNRFESRIPFGIMNCQALVSLDLSGNKLGDSLHDGFGEAFPNLQFLNLAGNGIQGKGSDLSGMVSLTYLNISSNLFQGSVIGVFEGKLMVIDLSRNQFQGNISEVNFSSSFNWSSLVYLDLSENQITGEFFPELNDARSLKHVNLAYNRFSPREFPHIDMLSGLEYMNFSGTNLIGEIPSGLSTLSSLKALDLSRNHLSSRIPSLNMKTLQILDVSYNNLSGDIPLSLIEIIPSMERFNFSYNNLTFCASDIPPAVLHSAFIGSSNGCPIAANPNLLNKKAQSHRGFKLALALTFSMVFMLLGLLILAFGCRRKTTIWAVKQNSYKEDQQHISGPFSFQTDSTLWVADVKQANSVPVVIFEKPLLNFTFADLLSATSNFDRDTLLAEGRFGPVYRGFLPGGNHVAVKVLVHGSTMTDQEAARELEYLGRIKHPNLVPLTGYCLAGDQRIAIYHYMENGNLQNLLHDLPLGVQMTEDWSTDMWEEEDVNGIQNVRSDGLLTTWRFRHKIALGTARALAFLHHGCSPPIIHRDVKASSVYLDMNLEPRLSDFGLAKIFGYSLEDEITNGSPGYTPPECLQPAEMCSPNAITPKSDVYGFGVVLFELITGKKPIGDDYPEDKDSNLVSWVRGLVKKSQASRAIDPKVRGTGPETEMVEALKIGYLCTAEHPSKRPSMQQIVGLLKDIETVNSIS